MTLGYNNTYSFKAFPRFFVRKIGWYFGDKMGTNLMATMTFIFHLIKINLSAVQLLITYFFENILGRIKQSTLITEVS